MAPSPLTTFLLILQPFRETLTRPAFAHLLVLFAGWVLSFGRHSITASLLAAGVSASLHHEAFHRFFSRGTWHPDQLACRFFLSFLLPLLKKDAPLRFVLDDTFCPHQGPKIFAVSFHRDPVRSSQKKKVLAKGHAWVTLALLVHLPFTQRAVALPLLFRLYRGKEECLRKGHAYRKKTQLAVLLLRHVASWVGERPVELLLDSGYCTDSVLGHLPKHFVVFGSMRLDAALTQVPVRVPGHKGRPRKKGERLPSPEQLARDPEVKWQRARIELNGREKEVEYKSLCGRWMRACGERLLRVVVVRGKGPRPLRAFFCTDAQRRVEEILSTYSWRVAIELSFRNLKQHFGFGETQAREQNAVLRTAPFIGLMYSVLLVWYGKVHTHPLAAVPVRPWYKHKEGDSFEDVLRCARRVLGPVDFLKLHLKIRNLPKKEALPDPPLAGRESAAA
jgi:hypothetical protein